MSSPPRFVPLSLSESLVTSSKPAQRFLSRPSSVGAGLSNSRRSLVVGANEKRELARIEAAAMCGALGLTGARTKEMVKEESEKMEEDNASRSTSTTTSTPHHQSQSQSDEIVSLKRQLSEQSTSLSLLQRQLDELRLENLELSKKCQVSEKGLGRRELEELEKSFATQEALLSGYQKESERSHAELEGLRNRQRRLNDFLTRTYGATWEQDLSLHLSSPHSTLGLPSLAASSPLRSKFSNSPRPSSMLLTPMAAATAVARGGMEPAERNWDSLEIVKEDRTPNTNETGKAGISSAQLATHLESIRSLILRSEERLLRREAEFGIMEREAKNCLEEAEEGRRRDLESLGTEWGAEEICA